MGCWALASKIMYTFFNMIAKREIMGKKLANLIRSKFSKDFGAYL